MNRRDLLKFVAGIVPTATVKILDAPIDRITVEHVVVIEVPEKLTYEAATRIRAEVRSVFGDRQRFIALCGGVKLKTVPLNELHGLVLDSYK